MANIRPLPAVVLERVKPLLGTQYGEVGVPVNEPDVTEKNKSPLFIEAGVVTDAGTFPVTVAVAGELIEPEAFETESIIAFLDAAGVPLNEAVIVMEAPVPGVVLHKITKLLLFPLHDGDNDVQVPLAESDTLVKEDEEIPV